jgi:hypothetical protein
MVWALYEANDTVKYASEQVNFHAKTGITACCGSYGMAIVTQLRA